MPLAVCWLPAQKVQTCHGLTPSPFLQFTDSPTDCLSQRHIAVSALRKDGKCFFLAPRRLPPERLIYLFFFPSVFCKNMSGRHFDQVAGFFFFFYRQQLATRRRQQQKQQQLNAKSAMKSKVRVSQVLGVETDFAYLVYVFFWEAQLRGGIKVQAKSSRAKRLGQT